MAWGEFGRLTPREVSALLKEYEEIQKREDSRHGVVVTQLSNLILSALGSKERHQMAEFFPSLGDTKGKSQQQTVGEMKVAARTWAAIFGGKWESNRNE